MAGRRLGAVALLVPSLVLADTEPACWREADGRVSCSGDGFAALVDVTRSARAGRERCEAQLGAVTLQRDAAVADREACEARPVEPAPPAVPQSRGFAWVGFAVGVAGALAIGAAATSMLAPAGTQPLALAAVGAVVVGVGAVLVTW